jgi:exopolysaccharide biosynthesis protein
VSWGWVVHDGTETSAPGTGTVAMSFVVDSAGIPSLLTPAELTAARDHVRLAFQSYPALLIADGSLPYELQAPGRGVDLDHRDSRLAIGLLADGSVIIALTRFTALGAGGETVPWGPTVVEMADFMRSLGCVRAMMLDGGISSQMSLRYADGTIRHWSNWRKVPLGLVIKSKAP